MEQSRDIKVNSLNAGMNKDVDPAFLQDGQYLNAINAKLNSHQGNLSLLQNEPSNFQCLKLNYDIIGSIKLPGSKYAIFSTNDVVSEIGVLDEETCKYEVKVNNTCLGFKRTHFITGRSKENFDCTISVYWTDNLNPRRFLNLDNIPYKFTIANDTCRTKTFTNELDCQALLLQPIIQYPKLHMELGTDGNVRNGVYQAALGYSINGQRITDYMSITAPVQVFSHENLGRALEVDISNIDQNFDEYELVIIYTNNTGSVSVDKIGNYDTAQSKVIVSGVGPTAVNNTALTLQDVVNGSVYYERAEDVISTSEYLIWTNPTAKTELNYQLSANKIVSKFCAYEVPADYYKKGGTFVGYLRDEVYAFAIQWLYNTGDWSPAYPIPGRRAESFEQDPVTTPDAYELSDPDNELGTLPKYWQVYNTAYTTPLDASTPAKVVLEGHMGYWESSERYVDNSNLYNEEDRCTPIRHHKLPDSSLVPLHTGSPANNPNILILGVRFENIEPPLDANGNVDNRIVGYRIVRSDRTGNKSIQGKGMIFNTGRYEELGEETLYANYPYNDVRPDPFLSTIQTKTNGAREVNVKPFNDFQNDKFTFHGPAFSFNNPSLGTELRVEHEAVATVKGQFVQVYKHPRHKLITNFAAGIAVLIGTAEGYIGIKGRTCVSNEFEGKATGIIPGATYKSTTHKCETALTKISGVGGIFGQLFSTATAILGGALAFGYYFNEGVDATLKVIKAFGSYQQYAYQYNSHGFYNETVAPRFGNTRRRIVHGQYLTPGVQSVHGVRFNNFQRESSVYLELDRDLDRTITTDNTRKTMSDFGLCGKDLKNTTSTAASYYASIKKSLPSQYGQLDSISYLDTGMGVFDILPGEIFSSPIVFGGDQRITRMTYKRHMNFFNQTLFDVQDGAEFNYIKYYNIPYPRFWINTEEYDSEEVRTLQLASNKHNFDCRNEEKNLFIIKNRAFYLSNSGIIDFYVESEYNLENRDWDDTINGRHYDRNTYTDYNDLLRSDRIIYDNKFLFDTTYLKQLTENFITKQNRNYDPELSVECFTTFKNRVIYSSPASKEQIKDNWRVYLPNNYFDFSKENGDLTAVKTFGRDRLLFLFDRSSPFVTMGIDTLQTDGGIKVTLGDGGLFERQPQRLVYTDFSYGSCQSKYAYVNTQYGGFYPSQRQGKVFRFTGEGIEEISQNGMNWWFSENLPSKLLKQFPDLPHTNNPLYGTCLLSVFDNTDKIYYLSKIDFRVKDEYVKFVKYNTEKNRFEYNNSPIRYKDPTFFEDCSWTVSFDPKVRPDGRVSGWVSFHDWHPEWTIQGENHFLTTKNRSAWSHNSTCTSYCNYYGENKPFELEFAVSSGQQVTTLSSLEWNLEAYNYRNDCYDPYHILEENFDDLVVYNTEQCSGLRKLNLRPKQLTSPYPIVNTNKIDIEFSKVEQKYRANQFWDVTRDRGEFSGKQIEMWESQPNGYRKLLNRRYLDYLKDPFQRKKFRHTYNKIIFRKNISGSTKFIFRYNNAKQLASFR